MSGHLRPPGTRNAGPRRQRRAWPIHAYVGANGGGKSAAMVWDTLPSLDAGRTVYSTARLLDYRNPRPCEGWTGGVIYAVDGAILSDTRAECDRCASVANSPVGAHQQAHPMWKPLDSWRTLLDATTCDVLLDEVTGVASSRESMGMPAPVANKLVQLRRADVVVRWSAPNWKRADVIIRECSQAVTYCRGYFSRMERGSDRQWRQRRLFRWKTYDGDSFEDFTVGKREQLRPMTRDWHWGPGSPTFNAYDTYDAVSTIGTVSDAGRCFECGGRRQAEPCSCSDYAGRQAARGSRAERGVPASAKREDTPQPAGRRSTPAGVVEPALLDLPVLHEPGCSESPESHTLQHVH